MSQMTALIAGATGAASIRLVEELLADPDWSVIGLSRNPPASAHDRLTYIRADLMDSADTRRALSAHPAITHAFYTSRAPFKEGGLEDVEGNVTMLENLIDGLEASAAGLAHVHLVTGSKWYGIHLGPGPSPAREDASRHMPPNFYYDQQDLLSRRQQGRPWTWSASRPNVIYDFAPSRVRNLVPTIGAWAAISKELGLPLDYPGHPDSFNALTDMTDATHLARALKWMATAETARNQAFNATDGDFFRWRHLWQRVADHFGMELGQCRPVTADAWMADKQPVWDRITARHGLEERPLADLAAWGFLDFLTNQRFDVVSSMVKIRQAGFTETVSSIDKFIEHLARYQDARLLP